MPLVAPLPPDHDPEIARLAMFFSGTLGFAPNSGLAKMRRPALARALTELNRAVMDSQGRVTSELKRLLGHVASRVAGCRDYQAHTLRAAERFGAREAADARRLEQAWQFRDSALFAPAEKAALEYAASGPTEAR